MGLGVEGKVLTRSILESLFILKAICNDEKLVQDFVLSHQAKQQKLLGIIFKKSNEDIFHRIKDDFTMEQLEKLKRENKEKGIREIPTQDWARKANLTSHYETAYRVLSDEVHTTPISLEQYLQLDKDKTIMGVRHCPMMEGLRPILVTCIVVLLMALDQVCNLFKVDRSEQIKTIEKRVMAMGLDNVT